MLYLRSLRKHVKAYKEFKEKRIKALTHKHWMVVSSHMYRCASKVAHCFQNIMNDLQKNKNRVYLSIILTMLLYISFCIIIIH